MQQEKEKQASIGRVGGEPHRHPVQVLQGFYSPKDTLGSELNHQGLCDI